jgi:hypothetical protein
MVTISFTPCLYLHEVQGEVNFIGEDKQSVDESGAAPEWASLFALCYQRFITFVPCFQLFIASLIDVNDESGCSSQN